MSAVKFLILAAIGTLFSWATLALVIFRLDPVEGGGLAKALFFFSLWLALIGSGTVIGFLIRHWLEREAVPFRQMSVAARQALNISTMSCILLALQSGRLLNIWTGVLVMLLAIGTEAFVIAGQSRHRTKLTYGTE